MEGLLPKTHSDTFGWSRYIFKGRLTDSEAAILAAIALQWLTTHGQHSVLVLGYPEVRIDTFTISWRRVVNIIWHIVPVWTHSPDRAAANDVDGNTTLALFVAQDDGWVQTRCAPGGNEHSG
jgi:hypothetical protein